MATGLPAAKTLIEFKQLIGGNIKGGEGANRNWINEQKADPYYNVEYAFDFKCSGEQEEDEEDIALAYFIEYYKSKLIRDFFIKKITGWLFNDCGIVPNEIKKN